MSLPGKQMGSLLNSYLLCISERVYRSSEQESNLNNWYQKTNSSFIDSQNPLKKGSMNPLYKGLHHAPQILTVSLFPSPPQKDLWLLPGRLRFCRKEKVILYEDYWTPALSWHWSQEIQKSLGSPSQRRGLWRSGGQWASHAELAHSGPSEPPKPSLALSPVLEYITGIDTLGRFFTSVLWPVQWEYLR